MSKYVQFLLHDPDLYFGCYFLKGADANEIGVGRKNIGGTEHCKGLGANKREDGFLMGTGSSAGVSVIRWNCTAGKL